MNIARSTKLRMFAALAVGCLSSAAFAQASDPAATPATHADQKANKAQSKADKKAAVAQARADRKKTDAQADADNDADKANADANVKDAKKQE